MSFGAIVWISSIKSREKMEKIQEIAQKTINSLKFGAETQYKWGMTFGEKVLKLMTRHGHSQAELARLIGTQPSSISNVTLGKQILRPMQILRLARCYGVSMESLLDDSMELVDTDPNDQAIMALVKLMGKEEALRRLSSTPKPERDSLPTQHPWGQFERPERPEMPRNGGEESGSQKGSA